jgi:hypothetical protein
MDPSRFAVTLAVLLIGVGLGRLVVAAAGSTGDVMATLFVPPDRALGWPHGVQELDEPWAWHVPPPQIAREAAGEDDDTDNGPSGQSEWAEPGHGAFVVPVDRVDPVHLGVRPH